MPGEHKDLLAKILQSVDLDLDSVEMIFQDEFSNLGVKSFLNCPVIAFIPLIPKHISALFAAEKYMINIINGNQFVACDALNELNQNRSLKRNLWEQLKLIYGI
jgi:DNA polymerase III psi subunit